MQDKYTGIDRLPASLNGDAHFPADSYLPQNIKKKANQGLIRKKEQGSMTIYFTMFLSSSL